MQHVIKQDADEYPKSNDPTDIYRQIDHSRSVASFSVGRCELLWGLDTFGGMFVIFTKERCLFYFQ